MTTVEKQQKHQLLKNSALSFTGLQAIPEDINSEEEIISWLSANKSDLYSSIPAPAIYSQCKRIVDAQFYVEKTIMKHITSEDIYKAATLKQESPRDRNFDKWHAYIELSDSYALSVVAGNYYGSTPRDNLQSFGAYSCYEAAFLLLQETELGKGFFMFGEVFKDSKFAIQEWDQIWSYKTMEEIVEMCNMVIDHINGR